MHEISFFLPVVPYGKGRARTFMRGGFSRTITPTKTRQHAQELHFHLLQELAKLNFKKPFEGPVEANFIFYIPRPLTVKTRIYPTVKPDDDNLCKQINDVFNKLVWIDDTQRVDGNLKKRYADFPQQPGIQVYVRQILTKEDNERHACKELRTTRKSLQRPGLTTPRSRAKAS